MRTKAIAHRPETPKPKKRDSDEHLLPTQARIRQIRHQNPSNPQYRSSFTRLFHFSDQVHLTEDHLTFLRQTPFCEFYIPILCQRITHFTVKKSDHLIHRILSTYDPDKQAFIIGKKRLTIKTTECQLIFGLTNGQTKLAIADGTRSNRPETEFYRRNFGHLNKVTSKDLKTALIRLQGSNTQEEHEDVTRIIVLSLMTNFFFTTSQSVNWSYFQCVTKISS
ncbi:hypothetical protein ACP275_14G230400 [Erythranthe tilingii]